MSQYRSRIAGWAVASQAGDQMVRDITLDELRSRRAEYASLLARSHADPLFHSLDWLELWWTHFGRPSEGEELVVTVVEEAGALRAALPIIRHVPVRRGPLRYRASSVLGNYPPGGRGIPSEYTTIVAEPGFETRGIEVILKHWVALCDDREISIGWTHARDLWCESLRSSRKRGWETVRSIDPKNAYAVDLRQGIESYKAGLSANARRSIFNVRRKLEAAEKLSFIPIEQSKAVDSLERMNRLHALRWGKPAFSADSLEFHKALIERLGALSEIRFSEVRAGDKVVSVLYDIRRCGRQYNLQMGFDPKAFPNASLGIIHLGYAIEEAASAGVEFYDFLGGEGMLSDYKSRYANAQTQLWTVQYFRGPLVNLALKITGGADAR